MAPGMGGAVLPIPDERRVVPRRPNKVDVKLRFGGSWYGFLHTQDISFDGAFIEHGPFAFAVNDQIAVRLHVPIDGHAQEHHFDAHVARLAADGVAIVFDDANLEAYAALLYLFVTPPQHAASANSSRVPQHFDEPRLAGDRHDTGATVETNPQELPSTRTW